MSCARSDLLGKACRAESGCSGVLGITCGLLAAGVVVWLSALITDSETDQHRGAYQLENHQISTLPPMGSTRSPTDGASSVA
jgi:hypothetical protein